MRRPRGSASRAATQEDGTPLARRWRGAAPPPLPPSLPLRFSYAAGPPAPFAFVGGKSILDLRICPLFWLGDDGSARRAHFLLLLACAASLGSSCRRPCFDVVERLAAGLHDQMTLIMMASGDGGACFRAADGAGCCFGPWSILLQQQFRSPVTPAFMMPFSACLTRAAGAATSTTPLKSVLTWAQAPAAHMCMPACVSGFATGPLHDLRLSGRNCFNPRIIYTLGGRVQLSLCSCSPFSCMGLRSLAPQRGPPTNMRLPAAIGLYYGAVHHVAVMSTSFKFLGA